MSDKKKPSINNTRRLLVRLFPNCFFSKESPTKRALKVGIDREVIEALKELGDPVPPRLLRKTMHAYTADSKYQQALADGGERVDLAGNPAGDVPELVRERARQRLLAIAQERKARIAAQVAPAQEVAA